MPFEHQLGQNEVLEKTSKALHSQGYEEEDISETLNVSRNTVEGLVSSYSDEVDSYETSEDEEMRLEVASEAGITVDQAAEFAGVPEDVAIDYLARNDEVKLTDGKRDSSKVSSEDIRRTLEGFYDEWMDVNSAASYAAEKSENVTSGKSIVANLEDFPHFGHSDQVTVTQQEDRYAEARGEDDTRFRAWSDTHHRDDKEYEFATETPEDLRLTGDQEPSDYEVMGEIDDEEIVSWLDENGLSQAEKVTAVLSNFDRDISDSAIQEYSEDGELSESAGELLEAKNQRGEFKHI